MSKVKLKHPYKRFKFLMVVYAVGIILLGIVWYLEVIS